MNDPSVASGEAPSKDPHLPAMLRVGDLIAPKAPQTLAAAGLEEGVLIDLGVKLAYSVAQFTTEWVGQKLQLSLALAQELLEKLSVDRLVEGLSQTGSAGHHRYKI